MTLREAIGGLIVVGLEAGELSSLERAWLRLIRPGGVILFRRNIEDAPQTRALLEEATGFCAPHAFRFVDLEGGTVNRLRDALAPIASAQAVSQAMRSGRKPALALTHGKLIARAVRAFSFNTTLAPVVDLGLPEAASILGTRTSGSTAEDVIAYAQGFLTGLASQHVAGCGKHFPGLGGATGDTHLVTPSIDRDFAQIDQNDLAPYRALHRLMPIIMTNHAAYPRTRSKATPASASRFWIADVLHKRLKYRGLVLSDDLEMGGILQFMSIEEAAVTAMRAGTDLLEICHSPALILRTYEALLTEAERSAVFRRMILGRAREVVKKRARLFAGSATRPLTSAEFARLRDEITRFNDQIASFGGTSIEAPRQDAAAERT